MELQKEFESAAAKAKELTRPSNDDLLTMYALYKQATEGDINMEKPTNPFDLVGNAKYHAWNKLKGTSKEEAMKGYIKFISELS